MKEGDFFVLKPESQEKSLLETRGGLGAIGLNGSVLEKQVALSNGWYLVLTTANSPYDEALYATLIDQDFKVLDQVELSGDMAPGILQDVQHSDEYTLKFSFNQSAPYSLDIDTNGFSFPRLGDISQRAFGSILKKKYIYLSQGGPTGE